MDKQGVSESTFYMWRAIFALAHADHVVSDEEKKFINKTLATVGFSDAQKQLLEKDIATPQDVTEMFMRISDQEDRSHFFYFARMLLWSDGDFAQQEQAILTELARTHFHSADVDKMLKAVSLELEDEQKDWLLEDMDSASQKQGIGGVLDRFLSRLGF